MKSRTVLLVAAGVAGILYLNHRASSSSASGAGATGGIGFIPNTSSSFDARGPYSRLADPRATGWPVWMARDARA